MNFWMGSVIVGSGRERTISRSPSDGRTGWPEWKTMCMLVKNRHSVLSASSRTSGGIMPSWVQRISSKRNIENGSSGLSSQCPRALAPRDA